MKILLPVLLSILIYSNVSAQEKLSLALGIITEPQQVSGGILFNVYKPGKIDLKQDQVFICKGLYKTSNADTVIRGHGTITTIYKDYIECLIKDKDINAIPQKGDLCFFIIEGLTGRKDVFYKLARFDISFRSVLDTLIFDAKTNLGEWNENKTNTLLNELTRDVQFTADAMLKQNNSMQQTIKGGDFDGKLLFTAMMQIKESDMLNFLKYVWARPTRYAGYTWNISEIFATWMISDTPKMMGEIE